LLFTEDTTYTTLNGNDVEKLWQPDLYIKDLFEFRVMAVLEPLRELYIDNNGSMWHRVTVSVTVGCKMHFEKFPFDTQSCSLRMKSAKFDFWQLPFHSKIIVQPRSRF
jgi:hypothetical protein